MCGQFTRTMQLIFILVCLILNVYGDEESQGASYKTTPLKGVHITLGRDSTEMTLVWESVFNAANDSNRIVFNYKNKSSIWPASKPIKDQEWKPESAHLLHKVTVLDLSPNTMYNYNTQGGSHQNGFVQKRFHFTTWPVHDEWSPTILLYSNLYKKSPKIHKQLSNEVKNNKYSAVFDIGNNLCGQTLYHMLENLTDIAAYTPYFTAPGRDGLLDKFQEYKNHFSMPDEETSWPMKNLWYSFDIPGKAHVISFSTEVFFQGADGQEELMIKWMEKDLQKANGAKARQDHPWIIAIANRPLYCTEDKCAKEAEQIRLGLEETLYYGGVDLVLQAAQLPVYERTWPVYKNITRAKNYLNPHYPMYINSGAFLCATNGETSVMPPTDDKKWCAKMKDLKKLPTYGRLTIANKTHLYYEEISALDGTEILDSVWITQYHHGPFGARLTHQPEIIAISVILALVLAGALVVFLLRKKIKLLLAKKQESTHEVHYAKMNTSAELA